MGNKMENSLSNNTLVKALPAFLAAARSESFAKASAILGMPKKTLNRYISQLEQYLDVALFIRQRNQLYFELLEQIAWRVVL